MSPSLVATKNVISRRNFLQVAGAMPFVSVFARQGSSKISVTDVNGLSLFQGAGCNVVAMRGKDGALMIDGGLKANADALLKAVKEKTGNSRIQTLINTHWHPEQVGCNEAVGREGGVIFAHEKTKMYLGNAVTSILFPGRFGPLANEGRPTKTTLGDGSLDFDGHKIDYGYMPAAHTDGDIYIHFPEQNVLVAGGVASAEKWPLIDHRNGAWFGGRVRAFQKLAGLVRPDTRVVPAEGRLMTGADVARHRDMYLELFQTLIAYMNMGMGPEDIPGKHPLKKYEAELGDPSDFLYGAFRSMEIAYVPD
jgi:cyclase